MCMMRTYRDLEKWSVVSTLKGIKGQGSVKPATVVLMLLLLISMTGCNRRYVVVNGSEKVTITKESLDKMYQDNELLLKVLEQCRAR